MRIAAAVVAVALMGSFGVDGRERKASGGRAVYRVEFDVRIADGDVRPAQHFSMLIPESQMGIFQAVSRVPTYTDSSEYIDVGAKIECMVHKSDGMTDLSASFELTSITGQVSLGALTLPIIEQRKAAIDTRVELGKPILMIDDKNAAATSMRRVEATVTKWN